MVSGLALLMLRVLPIFSMLTFGLTRLIPVKVPTARLFCIVVKMMPPQCVLTIGIMFTFLLKERKPKEEAIAYTMPRCKHSSKCYDQKFKSPNIMHLK